MPPTAVDQARRCRQADKGTKTAKPLAPAWLEVKQQRLITAHLTD
jgi:hypothetical protein